jgi:hypothetical protein
MKINFFIIFWFLILLDVYAQEAVSNHIVSEKSNRKDWPIELHSGDWEFNSAFKNRLNSTDKGYKKPSFKKTRYTSEEIERITFLLKNDVLPQGLKGERLLENWNIMPYYKSYWVGNLTMDGNSWYIIYVPKHENEHMPKELIPETIYKY